MFHQIHYKYINRSSKKGQKKKIKNLKDGTKWSRKWVVEVISSQEVLLDTVSYIPCRRVSH